MQDEEITTEESLPGTEQNVPAAGSEPAVSNVDGLTLEELAAETGKNFPTKEAALKSIKDTFKAVVQKTPQAPSVDTSKFVSKEQYEQDMFYSAHPEYASQKDIISALALQTGKPVSEVVNLDTFKTVFEKVQVADKIESNKSVLQSNPRLGQAIDKISQAKQAQQAGDSNAAATAAVDAVLDAYDLRK